MPVLFGLTGNLHPYPYFQRTLSLPNMPKAITTRFHAPANVRGSRYSATDSDGNRVYQHANDALSHEGNHDNAAIALCRKMSWHGVLVRGGISTGNVYVWLSDEDLVHINKL